MAVHRFQAFGDVAVHRPQGLLDVVADALELFAENINHVGDGSVRALAEETEVVAHRLERLRVRGSRTAQHQHHSDQRQKHADERQRDGQHQFTPAACTWIW